MFSKLVRASSRQDKQDRRLYLALIAATLLYCPLLFTGLDRYGRHDWDQFTFRYETPRAALLRDHQLPLWNPYVNGGTVLLAHPDSPFPSPWYLLVLALGAPLGLRVQVVLFMVLGSTGMAALLRRWNVPWPGCFVGGVIFMMSAHFALHIAEGHLEWCVLGLMPWLMLCMLRFDTDLRFVIVSALLLSSVLLFGSVYIMAVYVPFLSIWVLLQSLRQRSWRLAVGWAGALILTILLSAVKLLPQLEFVQANPRRVEIVGLSPAGLVHVFLDPRQILLYQATRDVESVTQMRNRGVSNEFSKSLPDDVSKTIDHQLRLLGVAFQWHEYGSYITYLGLLLAICGVVVSWRSHWPLYVAGFLALITVLGNGFPIDLWALLQKLPLYHSLQVPSRFLAAVVFVLAVAAGHGLGWLCQRSFLTSNHSLLTLIRYGVPLAIYLELAVLGWRLFGDVFICTPVPLPHYQNFALRYTQINTYFPTMYSYLYPLIAANSGVLEGYENIQVKRGKVRTVDDPDYKGEAYLETSGDPASIREWTMARVKIAFQVTKPDRLVLNQNYFSGWRATILGSSGSRQQPAVDNGSGLISIEVYGGDREVEFCYLPSSFTRGISISAFTLAACLLILLLSNKRMP
jgi:hypothetical protein